MLNLKQFIYLKKDLKSLNSYWSTIFDREIDGASIQFEFKKKLLFANLIRKSFENVREKRRETDQLPDSTQIDVMLYRYLTSNEHFPFLTQINEFFFKDRFKGMYIVLLSYL